MNEEEIIASAKKAHDELSANFYSRTTGLTKAQFDLQHGQIWSGLEAALIAAGYRQQPAPARDLAAEVDSLKERVTILEPRLP